MKKINFKTIFLIFILAAGLFVSCTEEPMLGNPDRLFRPIVKTATYNTTWIKLVWDRYTGAKSYEITLSVDSFQNVVRLQRTDSTQFTFTGLKMDQTYQIRIRSFGDSIMANGDTIMSEYYVLPDVTTLDYPTKLITPTSSDIIDNSVRLSWNVTSTSYSRIDVCINKDSAAVASINLTDADNIAGVKIVTGLNPATTYYLKIYDGDTYLGKKIVKTAAAQVFVGDVVDLREYSDDQSKTLITQTFMDSLALVYPNGFNMILSGGTIYTIPTVMISVNVNIVTGLSFRGKAIMAINGNFAVTGSKTVGSIRFKNVFFDQGNIVNKFKTDANYGGTYLFNFNQSGGNVDTLRVENCDVKYKRGFIRQQTTTTINYISVNNCTFDSIGGYGLINNGNDASYIKDIVFTNSTVSHADKLFVCGKLAGINSITVDHLTSCYSPLAGQYFLDYNTNTIPGGVVISNSVFGIGNGTAPALVNGIRSAATSVSVTNCFRASDLGWAVNATTLVANYPIDDFVDLGVNTIPMYTDPNNYNFKVTNSKLVNKVGDPRWWK